MMTTFELARTLASQGISTIPINDTRAKSPAVGEWKSLQSRLPTEEELLQWYERDRPIALVCGEIQCIDFDVTEERQHIEDFTYLAHEQGMGDILDELTIQRTPSGGLHYFFRCPSPIGNMKLAMDETHSTLIETRGKGGYVLIHPTNGYDLLQGSLTDIVEISQHDRETLLDLCRAFDRSPVQVHTEAPKSTLSDGTRPGDLFGNDLEAFFDLLAEHGWESVRSRNYWRRPGKSRGISATWDKVPGRFYVFSSNAYPLEPNKVYTPFAVYAQLVHAGDYKAAANKLAADGYGLMDRAKASLEKARAEAKAVIESEPEVDGRDPDRWYSDLEPNPARNVCCWLETVHLQRGNISVFAGKSKSGKSAFIQALIGAMLGEDGDFLGWRLRERKGAVLYFDFEQGPDDFIYQIRRIFGRGNANPDSYDWLRAYRLRDYPLAERKKRMIEKIERALADYGSIDLIVLDGGSDLVADVNDGAESTKGVGEWLTMSTEYDCHIAIVIHTNEGNAASDKVRGHVGSESMRKGEATFMLEKVDADRTHVWTPKHRRAGISEKEPFEFAWNEEEQMHTSCGMVMNEKMRAKIEELAKLAKDVFGDRPSMKLADFRKELMASSKKSKSTISKQTTEMLRYAVIRESALGLVVLG